MHFYLPTFLHAVSKARYLRASKYPGQRRRNFSVLEQKQRNPSALVMYPPIGICNYGKARIFVLAARPFYSNVVAAVIVAIGAFVAPH